VIVFVIGFMSIVDVTALINQLTRGRGNVDVSGRDLIWAVYFQNIGEALFFGNSGLKNYLFIPAYGYMHAHNSLIMSLYVYGVIPLIVVFFPIAILIFIRPTLIIVLSPLVIYSMGQFFLFWGASFSDIIFMSIVISASNIKHTKNESKAIKNESKAIKNESKAIKK
jgi:hypothetical protein